MDQGKKFARPIRSNRWVQQQRRPVPWIWEGVLAADAVTLLSAPEKMGKTTLLSLLLDRRRGGGTLLGRTVYPGKTIVCSEENELLWALRQPPLDFGPDLIFHQPIGGCPTRRRWADFIGEVLILSEEAGPFDLVAIDTAARFMPLAQRDARRRQWALSELELLAGLPAAVLLLNQSRTMHRPLAAFADIVLEMDAPRGVGATRRRCFTGVGRYRELLQTATAELNAAGTDYELSAGSPPPQPPLLAILQSLLTQSPDPLTHRELLARWPGDAPRADSLWRTLARGCETGLFVRSGTGTKTDAFRFGMASQAKGAEGEEA